MPAVLLMLAVALSTRSSSAQSTLSYDHTTFLHGFGSDGSVWTFAGQPGRLRSSFDVDLRIVRAPSTGGLNDIPTQATSLRDSLVADAGKHVLTGHSMGGLVARDGYTDPLVSAGVRPNVTAILTVNTPHQGTPLANNVDRLLKFANNLTYRLDAVISVIKDLSFGLVDLRDRFPDPTKSIQELGGVLNSPGVQDLRTDAKHIADLQLRTDDAAIRRANIISSIPDRDAALRVQATFTRHDDQIGVAIAQKNKGIAKLESCRAFGYVVAPLVVVAVASINPVAGAASSGVAYAGPVTARKCGYAKRDGDVRRTGRDQLDGRAQGHGARWVHDRRRVLTGRPPG